LNDAGAVLGASGSLNDITERKLAEAQAQKLAAFPRVNPNPVLEFAADGTLSYANDAAFELAKSLGKQQILDMLPPAVNMIVADCLACGVKRLNEEVGISEHTITWSFFPVAGSGVVHCYGADITEKLRLEAQSRHAQKLEFVGQVAAGIAHDFNNLLTVIQGYAECLLQHVNGGETMSGQLKQIACASRRATALTRQLLMLSRKQVLQARILDLNTVVRDLGDMLPRLLGDDIALEMEFSAGLPAVKADVGMIEQVVMNLAVNARDAMPKGGRLLLTTSVADIGEACARQRPDARAGRFVCLTVLDSGCGMDAKTRARIFEPFFSTKEPGHGTGLGLATVYGIVKQHEGWVEVATEAGAGTMFTIFFPATAAVVVTEDTSAASPIVRGGKETILLVEDEPVLREMAGMVLAEYDYHVLEAASGVEALRVWDRHEGKIDLVLTDMVMPEGMTGSELAVELRKRDPEIKVIYSSGYSSEVLGRSFRGDDTVFLQKPYGPPQLARHVRKCLDAEPKPDAELLLS
jgi:signal transduction histidine kinase